MLFNDIIFGPVNSRRLGVSLGVNLLSTESKLCNFNCIYCECGWNPERMPTTFHDRELVGNLLEKKLLEMKEEGRLPDVITFAGNGEPTLHPDFAEIIDQTIQLRNRITPGTKISVLSNGTMVGKDSVRGALLKVDNNILKLDSAMPETLRKINKPSAAYHLPDIISKYKKFGGELIIQTMILRGECDGQPIDNTTVDEIDALIRTIKDIDPKYVMLYSLDRATPSDTLTKVETEELKAIAQKFENAGIRTSVAG